ncbi:MAG: hypothetical protein M5Z89_18160, partial [Olivibacter sp.]|nr:hypothetical protein [Olivibacter sp. UJ_SKK_5.1]
MTIVFLLYTLSPIGGEILLYSILICYNSHEILISNHWIICIREYEDFQYFNYLACYNRVFKEASKKGATSFFAEILSYIY